MINRKKITAQELLQQLTSREKEVLEALSLGLNNREIGQELFICETTVKVHLRHIFKKLKVKSRTEALLFYLQYK
ncbi:LuxR C-terminal-related transcriptional regulator [Vibrio sp. SS-MA-C1-2]|uniref:response regulator transcription factor n=1 Tax=Vibrio sp. SS-MA-C1-2 TaxID=2908646 RepID=UPI001F2AB606|nr:LuxR C-terminal-related transcriptional regulator [Vibrio sp. SS-MA-C1-2]UJF19792.1 LuxR C-terminal-related transcriptional regulator [Vibrio sp. SS-MA-C1-2]